MKAVFITNLTTYHFVHFTTFPISIRTQHFNLRLYILLHKTYVTWMCRFGVFIEEYQTAATESSIPVKHIISKYRHGSLIVTHCVLHNSLRTAELLPGLMVFHRLLLLCSWLQVCRIYVLKDSTLLSQYILVKCAMRARIVSNATDTTVSVSYLDL